MRGTFELVQTKNIRAAITIEGTIEEWSTLRAQLCGDWPACDLSRIITDLISQTEKTLFSVSITEDGGVR